jgi:hypothetical protein
MKRPSCFASARRISALAGSTLALLALALTAVAQAPTDQVPFKATVGPYVGDVFVVPVSPPIASGRTNAKGEATLLGPVTYLDLHTIQLGVDGGPLFFKDGIGVMTAANGDALFITRSGLSRATPTGVTGEFGYIVTGGRGRFAGATGSGVGHQVFDRSKNEATVVFEGTISAPKAQ